MSVTEEVSTSSAFDSSSHPALQRQTPSLTCRSSARKGNLWKVEGPGALLGGGGGGKGKAFGF
jgi:hypothetical protein